MSDCFFESRGTTEENLAELASFLRQANYKFVTISPNSHRIYETKNGSRTASDLRDVFGWNLKFDPDTIDSGLLHLLQRSNLLSDDESHVQSRVRCSTRGPNLYFHSSFPTDQNDAVFFGPDTYRFLNVLDWFARGDLGRLVDIGCGTGAGAIALSARCRSVTLTDINPQALTLARANARINAVQTPADFICTDFFRGIDGTFDTVISNPPFIVDARERAYRHGGSDYGTALSERIAQEAYDRLSPGGRIFIYTGAPQVRGQDIFKTKVEKYFSSRPANFSYFELDPDIFGEELLEPAYAEVERLAAVTLIVEKT